MRDFRVTSAKVQLKLAGFAPIRNFRPPSIILTCDTGNNFQTAQDLEIFYNGVQAKEYFVQTPTRMIVKIPPSQVGVSLEDIRVTASVKFGFTASLSLEVSKPLKTVDGIERLVQSWLLLFLTTPNSDIFSPKSGGGGRSFIGRNTDPSGKGPAADLALAIERTQSELLRLQASDQRIPPAEKLLSSKLESISFDQGTSTLSARVAIRSMAGRVANVTVG